MTQENVTTEYMGARVDWTGNDAAPAVLYGSRGAVYGALRPHESDDDWCFLVNLRGGGPTAVKLRGNGWLEIPRGSQLITGAR